ncbi:vegetative cell wall protein gp1-like [Motacilla alba alba]|uniref:vegetative cell wall protein gp1-like n=1 Tax=Motacilla alba alba TaxID=1094192 RepID=UPI0018D5509B|nr:vegetative cell wall protein gp1-like [Motacilla alba alba]
MSVAYSDPTGKGLHSGHKSNADCHPTAPGGGQSRTLVTRDKARRPAHLLNAPPSPLLSPPNTQLPRLPCPVCVCEERIGCRTDRSTLLPITVGPASFPSTGNTPADRGQPGVAAASHWSDVLSVLCSPASPDGAQQSPPLLPDPPADWLAGERPPFPIGSATATPARGPVGLPLPPSPRAPRPPRPRPPRSHVMFSPRCRRRRP